jgi:hypothetical protein
VTERPSYDEKQAWAVLVWRACCQRYVFATSAHGPCGQCWTYSERVRGLCFCGCGKPAPISKRTTPDRGDVEGHPVKYIVGHAYVQKREFWSLVDKSGGPDACWLWTGLRDRDGYGNYGGTRAHRFVKLGYEKGGVVRHRCDNPPCVNPDHLIVGTHAENTADAVARGRTARGDRNAARKYPGIRRGARNSQAILNDDAVRAIRARYADGESRSVLAREYGVSKAAVHAVLQGRTWSHVS